MQLFLPTTQLSKFLYILHCVIILPEDQSSTRFCTFYLLYLSFSMNSHPRNLVHSTSRIHPYDDQSSKKSCSLYLVELSLSKTNQPSNTSFTFYPEELSLPKTKNPPYLLDCISWNYPSRRPRPLLLPSA